MPKPSPELHIETFALGEWQTNCYVAHTDSGGCWIIDAGFDPAPMLAFLEQHQLEPAQLLLTHAHVDHIAGLAMVRERYSALPILIHEAEQAFLTEPMLNLSIMLDEPVIAPAATRLLHHGEHLALDDLDFEVRHTPGHSPGGITLYCASEGVAFVGDALFAGSIGRHDFPTSDGPTLLKSIRGQLLSLPEATRVLPGHGPLTTISEERWHNPYLVE